MNQPTSLQTGTRVDDYEITDTLWTTNSGFIYRARDLDRDRDVLVQEYLPAIFATRHWSGIHAMPLEGLADEFDQGLTRFLREARILAQINDPYVCRVYEYMETNATAYMVLDYEPGQTLMEHLAGRKDSMVESEIRQLLVPLLKGLRVAHAADLLHRDIHPSNIYLRDVGPPVLIGFGSPVVALRDDAEHHVEQRVAPGYSPVEQYQSDGDIGPWSDLYALGATMYRCLSGATPVDATRRITHIAQEKEDPLVPAMELGAGDYSAGLLSAIDWMLEPMASDRPESAGAVLGSLADSKASTVERTADAPPESTGAGDKSRPAKKKREQAPQQPLPPPARQPDPERDRPAAAPSEPAATQPDSGAALKLPQPVVNLYRSRMDRRRPLSLAWPVLAAVAGLALIGTLVFQAREPRQSASAINPTTDASVPAPAPEVEYPPPEIPATVKFDREQDDERAAEYRDLERRVERTEQALTAAAEHMAAGRLVAPEGDNALAAYRSVLALDPDNTDAKLGLGRIQRRLVESAKQAFAAGDIDEARRLLDQAADVRGETEQVAALRDEIQQHLAEQERARAEQRRLEEAERARQAQIASLLEKAEAAFRDERLTRPPGDNALGYYRRVLELEPGHEAARAGVDRIGRTYLDWTADALAKDQLDKADGLLSTAAAVLPDNESVALLQKQLETRRAAAARERQREAAARERQREAADHQAAKRRALRESDQQAPGDTDGQALATQATQVDADSREMKVGITAYYGGNYDFAFRRLNPLAERGNPRAKFRVAMMYYHGRGTTGDRNLAETLIREALPAIREQAEAGVAWAQADLGSLYADGIVLEEDDAEAIRLYRLAAEQGYAGAQTNLGVMYANGEGVTQSREDAVLWLRRAAAQGDRIAQNNLQTLGVE